MPTKASSLFGGGGVPVGAIVDGNFEGNPEYLLCDGATYTSSSYPDLNKTGLSTWGSNTFVSRALPATQMWTSVAFGAGVFVAVGHTGASISSSLTTTTAASSPDGVTWTSRTIPSGAYHQVIYGGGQFVAIGLGCAATSPDGITWTARTQPVSDYAGSIAYGNGLYVVSFYNSTAGVITSPDGITWTLRAVSGTHSYGTVSYLPSMKVFVFSSYGYNSGAVNSGGLYWASSDGVNWRSYSAYTFVASGGNAIGPRFMAPYLNRMYEFAGLLWTTDAYNRVPSRNGGESWDAEYRTGSGGMIGADLHWPVNSKLFATKQSSSANVVLGISRDGIDFDYFTFTGSYAAWFCYFYVGNIAYGNGAYVITQSGNASSNQSSACMTLLEDSTKFSVPKLNKSFTGAVKPPYIKVA